MSTFSHRRGVDLQAMRIAPNSDGVPLSDGDPFPDGVARVWRLHHVVFLSAMAALSDPARLLEARIIQFHPGSGLGMARIAVTALQALTPVLLIALCVVAARRESPFRRWYERSRRWWLVPAGLFAVAAIPRWFASQIDPGAVLNLLVPVAEAALGIGLLWGFVPLEKTGTPAELGAAGSLRESGGDAVWLGGLRRLWIPAAAVGFAIWAVELRCVAVRSSPGLIRAGLVNPISVIAVAYILWIGSGMGSGSGDGSRAALHRRVGMGAALFVSLLFLWPWPGLWTDYIYRSSPFSRLNGWAWGVPAFLEISRDAELTYGLFPFASPLEFVAVANQPGSAAAREFARSAAVGGFTVASIAPLLLMVALGLAIRRRRWRWPLLLLAMPIVFVCCLCDTTLVSRPPWPAGGGPSLVLYPWKEFLAKAAWVTLAMGALVAWVSSLPVSVPSRGEGKPARGAWRWIIVYVLFSSAISLFLAAALSLGARRNSEAAAIKQSSPSSRALLNLLDTKFPYSALRNDDVSEFQTEVLYSPSNADDKVDKFAVLWAETMAALPELARFESRDDLVAMRADYVDVYSVDYMLSLQSALAAKALGGFDALATVTTMRFSRYGSGVPAPGGSQPSVRPDGILFGIEATSTTLHALVAVDRVAPSGNWHRSRAGEDIFRVCDGIVGYLQSTTNTLLREESVERLLDATRLSDTSQFLITGRADILWRMVQPGDMVRFWPGRVVADLESGSFANLRWLYSSSSESLFAYHWIRTRLRCLLFRQRVGRFPNSWRELQSELGREATDGILEILDAPFSAYLTFTVAPDDSLTLVWGLPPGHPMAAYFSASSASPATARLLGPLFVPPPPGSTPLSSSPSSSPAPAALLESAPSPAVREEGQ